MLNDFLKHEHKAQDKEAMRAIQEQQAEHGHLERLTKEKSLQHAAQERYCKYISVAMVCVTAIIVSVICKNA